MQFLTRKKQGILLWGIPCVFFKCRNKIAVICKTGEFTGFRHILSAAQERFRAGYPQQEEIVKNRRAGVLLKTVAQIVFVDGKDAGEGIQ